MKSLRKVAMAISAFLDVQMPGAQPHHDAWNVGYRQFLRKLSPGTNTGRGPSSVMNSRLFIRSREQRRRHVEAEGSSGLGVDDQFQFRRLLPRAPARSRTRYQCFLG